jgi:streptomycin 6-kinase
VDELERVAGAVAAEWGLELGPRFGLARFSFAAPAGDDAVLKVVPERHWESDHEPDALAHWDGDGAVRLLRRDGGRRAFLLERAVPGTDVSRLPDDEATAIALDVGRRLWRPAGAPFRRVTDVLPRWLEEAEGELRRRAEQLLAGMELRHDVLVHGDFHHHNLLSSARGHLAVDPQPFLGEPEYDVVPFLWNPLPIGIRAALYERRVAAFAAAGLDEARIRAWTVIRGSYLLPEQPDALLGLARG